MKNILELERQPKAGQLYRSKSDNLFLVVSVSVSEKARPATVLLEAVGPMSNNTPTHVGENFYGFLLSEFHDNFTREPGENR